MGISKRGVTDRKSCSTPPPHPHLFIHPFIIPSSMNAGILVKQRTKLINQLQSLFLKPVKTSELAAGGEGREVGGWGVSSLAGCWALWVNCGD